MIELNESYEFIVKKAIELPVIGKQYVMEAVDGEKHLMPAEPYEKYPIDIGESIKCYIDKINCVGKIFLEPEHPFYKRGKNYTFKIKFISEPFYKKGKYRRKLFIESNNGEIIEAIPSKFNYNIDLQKPQACKVLKIKKGKLVITNNLIDN